MTVSQAYGSTREISPTQFANALESARREAARSGIDRHMSLQYGLIIIHRPDVQSGIPIAAVHTDGTYELAGNVTE